ncbi:429_t:CDS:2, partial [Gigaspora margarita]
FVDDIIIISQDDKAKVSLGISTVGRTFKTIQTINEPISVANYNFPVSSKMKPYPPLSRQSAYNPIEHSMASLSEKLAGITLLIDEFGSHLDSQEKVVNEDLARKNFEFAGKSLCDIWERDNIHGRPVITEYINQIKQLFTEIGSSF